MQTQSRTRRALAFAASFAVISVLVILGMAILAELLGPRETQVTCVGSVYSVTCDTR